VDEVVGEPVGRSCPACGGELEPRSEGSRGAVGCVGCDWVLSPPVGYEAPGDLRLSRCPDGHLGCWSYRRLSRRLSWRCAAIVRSGDRRHRCMKEETEAVPQGFLSGQSNPVFSTRDAVIAGLYTLGAGGGFVEDMLPLLPHLKPSQVYSCLYRLVRYRRPYVLKSRLTEPRIRTYAHRYILSPEGVAFAYLMWPALVDREDSWKHQAVR
jgi:hypothetical protein